MLATDASWTWGLGVIVFAFGLGVGFLISYLLTPRASRTRELEEELEQVREEHREYRDQVNAHFQKTGELFEGMTEQYRSIYHHLAGGAQNLCEGAAALGMDPTRRLEADNDVDGEVSNEAAVAADVEPPAKAEAGDGDAPAETKEQAGESNAKERTEPGKPAV